MILSYHPCFEADKNRICAGRLPDETDRAVIRSADAVVLPQGCSKELYRMAAENCRRVFPDYTARFAYPGKLGQARLFRETGARHPETRTFSHLAEYAAFYENQTPLFPFPFVLKMDWGGEGDNVHLIGSADELAQRLEQVRACEASGQRGFLIQRFVPCGSRSLRVVVIYQKILTYWRTHDRPGCFYASLSKGARMERDADPELQESAAAAVKDFCSRTGINLAGFDVLFSTEESSPAPLLLEINYFFGRQGIGGSQVYYDLLVEQIRRWIADRIWA